MTCSFLEEIITSSNEVFNDCESDKAVGIRKLGNLTRETAESNVTGMQTAGCQLLTQQLQAKKSDL